MILNRVVAGLILLWSCALHAQIGITFFPGPGTPASSGASFSLTYESSAQSSSTTSPISYPSMTYGSGCTRVIAAVAWRINSASSISSMTVNGVSMTQVSGASIYNNVNEHTDIWESNSAVSGSSGTVSITYSNTIFNSSMVALYCLVTTTPTANAGNAGDQINGATVSFSLNIPSGGGGIVFSYTENNTAPNSQTNWTTDATLTPAGGNGTPLFGHSTATGASTTIAMGLPSNDGWNLSAASWGP